LFVLAACWTSEVKPVPDPKPTTTTTTKQAPHDGERRAIVRIDAQPGGKKFQGVWLEFADDTKWVVDYRAREIWKSFQDREVLVTGYCWAPDPRAQAIGATHFHVEHMTFVKPEMGRGPILSLGPEQILIGAFREQPFPAGSKRAGSSETHFDVDGGTSYSLQGASVDLPAMGTRVSVVAREIEPDRSWTAQTGGPKLWILDVRADGATVEERAKVPCPQ
jgi:hypothetical protein